jgi:hypothetical protein
MQKDLDVVILLDKVRLVVEDKKVSMRVQVVIIR